MNSRGEHEPVACLQEKVAHFYQRFVASRNFKIWMARQQAAAVAWQERAWQRAQLEHGIQAIRPALGTVPSCLKVKCFCLS